MSEEKIEHYDKLPENWPDATYYDYGFEEENKEIRLAFARQQLEEHFSNKTHKIISYSSDDDILWYRIIKK